MLTMSSLLLLAYRDIRIACHLCFITTTIDITTDISTHDSPRRTFINVSSIRVIDIGLEVNCRFCTDIHMGITNHLGSITSTKYIINGTHLSFDM